MMPRPPAPLLAAALILAAGVARAQPPLEDLPAILQLQPSQHPAWRAYKDAVAQSAADGARQASMASTLNTLSTPARMEALRTQMKEEASSFGRQADATDAFYSILSPEQRDVFDRVTRLPEPRPPLRRLGRTSGGDGGASSAPPTLRLPPDPTLPRPPGD